MSLLLGERGSIEGDRPGSDLTYVEAPDLATLACLQKRLNELGKTSLLKSMVGDTRGERLSRLASTDVTSGAAFTALSVLVYRSNVADTI